MLAVGGGLPERRRDLLTGCGRAFPAANIQAGDPVEAGFHADHFSALRAAEARRQFWAPLDR